MFQSTHPVGGGTYNKRLSGLCQTVSIHPPRGGWDIHYGFFYGCLCQVSIHPPRGGWDTRCRRFAISGRSFNPPTPWGVGLGYVSEDGVSNEFQSTHPVGGGTTLTVDVGMAWMFQSTHPVGGGTCGCSVNDPWQRSFNPPTPWGVGLWHPAHRMTKIGFQSTHPVGGGTTSLCGVVAAVVVSIHPPRGGWDELDDAQRESERVSIHPPRGGWDDLSAAAPPGVWCFNPPTPWGVGQQKCTKSFVSLLRNV